MFKKNELALVISLMLPLSINVYAESQTEASQAEAQAQAPNPVSTTSGLAADAAEPFLGLPHSYSYRGWNCRCQSS